MIGSRLVTPTAPFIGRTLELNDLKARLADPTCRLLTLTGLGGSGKTRLAVEVAQAVASQFPDGVVFVPLQQISTSDVLVHTIAQAVGLTFYGEDEAETQLLATLRQKNLLLVLDNFEHLLAGTPLLSAILVAAPQVKILVTSREALNLREEWLYPLTGMSVPLSVYSTSLEDYDAVQLFLYHARRMQREFDVETEREAIIAICRMAAGLPLAIELATSWLKGLTAAQIAREMRENLAILSTTMRNVEERHRSMQAVFDHSWQLLSDTERKVFARLSVFQGSIDHVAAERVAEAPLVVLADLVEKSLVQREAANRFSIHELLRQYAMKKLEAYGETETTSQRHAAYFANLLQRYEDAMKQPEQPKTMQAIEIDFDNIRLAWEWSARWQQADYLHQMLNGLYLFGFLSNRHLEIIEMFKQTLAQGVEDVPLRGRLLARRWGFLHWWFQPDYQETLNGLGQALEIALAEDNQFEIAFIHLMLAYTFDCTERDDEALPHSENSKRLFAALDEPFYVSWTLTRQAYVYFNLNDYGKAFEVTHQSLSLSQLVRNRFALLVSHYFLGLGSILNGDYVNGNHHASEALQYATELGQPCQLSHAFSLLALCAFCQGDFDTSERYARRSFAVIEDVIHLIFQPLSLSLLIVLACLREDYAEGVRLKKRGIHHGTNLTDLQVRYWALGVLVCGLADVDEARHYTQKMLHLTENEPDSALLTWIAPTAAYVLSEVNPVQAVELLSWAWAVPDHTADWIRQWPLFDRIRSQLQDALGADAYEEHWERGKSLTFATVNASLRRAFADTSAPAPTQAHDVGLTHREIEILRLMAEGLTNPQIAERLFIGAGTVKTHTLSIYRKLDVANRSQAILRAQALDLLA